MRLIDADHLKENIRYGWVYGVMYERLVDKEPTVDPVRHGHWISRDKYHRFKCSKCGDWQDREYPYCGYCGCKMDEVTK